MRTTPSLRFAAFAVAASLLLGGTATANPKPPADGAGGAVRATAASYVEHFYPRWFTYLQNPRDLAANSLTGPATMSPVFGLVVAPNDDTLYVRAFVDMTNGQPLILTVPSTTATYSLLTTDLFGNVFTTGVSTERPGTYALTPPGWSGTLPPGVTQIPVPLAASSWIFRADKYSSDGTDMREEAERFRLNLHLATPADYQRDPSSGQARVLPVIVYGAKLKELADREIGRAPLAYLRQLQRAMHDRTTAPLSPADQALADRFDRLFGNGVDPDEADAFARGAQEAHARIVRNYLTHQGPTNWVHFTNVGIWTASEYLDRSSISEFLQYGNSRVTAAYYHAFTDGSGARLDASEHGYRITFPAGQLPQARRFWSVTSYLPKSVTLVPNDAEKYVVASYTPGLVTAPDGSVTVYMTPKRPEGVPAGNWLPVPDGPFNVMLRVYGPEGSVADNTYVPPAVTPLD
ncbi:DUF1214 domain-containing protein [Streptomyces sp. NPDC058412]|uniref:DUF1214 domain-containing protein n=1 Tax=Streptomyces sp. NPDC058412 TaxID=3346486 RepID=UPI003663ED55